MQTLCPQWPPLLPHNLCGWSERQASPLMWNAPKNCFWRVGTTYTQLTRLTASFWVLKSINFGINLVIAVMNILWEYYIFGVKMCSSKPCSIFHCRATAEIAKALNCLAMTFITSQTFTSYWPWHHSTQLWLSSRRWSRRLTPTWLDQSW